MQLLVFDGSQYTKRQLTNCSIKTMISISDTRTRNLLGLLLLTLLPSNITAIGGFFGRPAQKTPASSSGDAIVFGMSSNDDGSTFVRMQFQVEYHASDEFAWILPVPSVPSKLELGSSLLFHTLFQETLPKFELEIDEEGELLQVAEDGIPVATSKQGGEAMVTGGACDASVLEQDCPEQGPTRGGEAGAVTVWKDGHAGLLDFAVVEAIESRDLLEWLIANNYTVPEDTTALEDVLDKYLEQGNNVYVVMKVAPKAPAGAVQPISVEYELPTLAAEGEQVHKVPTLLSSLSASASEMSNRTLQVYFFSEVSNTRAIPVNYLDMALNDAHVDWVGCLSDSSMAKCYYDDYIRRYTQAITEVDNQKTLTTEYNGASNIVENKVAIANLDLAEMESSETWLDFFLTLEAVGVPPIASVQAIIDRYVPPKSFEINTPFQCVQWDHAYQPNRQASPSLSDCYSIFIEPEGWTWDPVGLGQELEELILAPARAAQTWIDQDYTSLTRLYGQIPTSDATMEEPYFVITTEKPKVDNIHRARAVPVCDLDSPNALEITLVDENAGDPTTFWQPAILTCPTWQKTSPRAVFSRDEAQPRIVSMAQQFSSWGVANQDGVHVQPSEDGSFAPTDIDEAAAYGNVLLGSLTGSATTLMATDGDSSEESSGIDISFNEAESSASSRNILLSAAAATMAAIMAL